MITAEIRQQILSSTPQKRPFDQKKYAQEIHRIYGSSAQGILELQERAGTYRRIIPAEEKQDEIRTLLAEVPTPAQFEQMLSRIGLEMPSFWAMYGKEKVEDGVLYAKDLKDRYTVLNLYYDFFRKV